jgi:hypothetical protein
MDQGCKFLDHQLLRAVHEGSVSILQDEIRELYPGRVPRHGAANGRIEAVLAQARSSGGYRAASTEAQRLITEAGPKIAAAKEELLKFLSSDGVT